MYNLFVGSVILKPGFGIKITAVTNALFLQNRIKGTLDQYTVFDTVLMVRFIALGLRMEPLDCGLTQLENHTAFGNVLKVLQTHKL